MFFLRIYKFCIFLLFFSSFSSHGIYHWETKKELQVSKVSGKYWLLVDQNCHSCDSVLLELETFCKDKKPSSQSIGFFVIGFNKASITKKLRSFRRDYDVYLGSPSEFFNSYNVQGSPSLLLKGSKKIVQGKDRIMKKVKDSSDFCVL